MADWATISALATAGGTLALAGVTLASVRSANRAARVAEQSLLAAQRPLLVTSSVDDPPQKVGFMDDVWFQVGGAQAAASATDHAVKTAAQTLGAQPTNQAGEERATSALAELIRAGQADGTIQPDVTVEDLYLLFTSAPTEREPAARARWLTLVLRGLTTEHQAIDP